MARPEQYLSTFPIDFPALVGKMVNIKLDGPTQAVCFALLWESMLCRVMPNRGARAEIRATTPRTDEDSLLSQQSFGVEPVSPDSVWLALYMQTAVALDFEVHAALWAPYTNPATGNLPEENLDYWIKSKIPADVQNKGHSPKFYDFLRAVTSNTVPTKEFLGVHLRLKIAQPVMVQRDRDDLIHAHAGPAVVFPDGTGVYFWRGMPCPPDWLPVPDAEWHAAHPECRGVLLSRLRPHTMPTTTQALTLGNLELRRIATEIVGWDAIVNQLRPLVLDTDPDPTVGQLVQVNMPVPNAWNPGAKMLQCFLRVQCGTGRSFSLAVPPNMRTARQANAWTYGLEAEEYAPEVRT